MCFCQLIGIPMDSNPATFMAILFLYYYEKKGRKLSSSVRFIDLLCIFNNSEFENNYNDIYSDELELKIESKDPCKASFWDLSI